MRDKHAIDLNTPRCVARAAMDGAVLGITCEALLGIAVGFIVYLVFFLDPWEYYNYLQY